MGSIAVCDSDVIVYDDDSRLIHLFDRFENVLVYFWWIDFVVFLLWANTKGAFRSEYVDYYRCGGRMLYAAVEYCILVITVFSFMVVVVINTIIFFFVTITSSEFFYFIFYFYFFIVERVVNFWTI